MKNLAPLTLVVLPAFVLGSGCVHTRVLPRRPTPAWSVPSSLAEGRRASDPSDAPVVIDLVDGHGPVRRITSAALVRHSADVANYQYVPQETCSGGSCSTSMQLVRSGTHHYTWVNLERTSEPVCARTPCRAYLPRGSETLIAGSAAGWSDVTLDVEGPLFVRHAPTLHVRGMNLWPVTLMTTVLGACAAVIGLVLANSELYSQDTDYQTIGWSITGGGAGLAVLGTLALAFNRDDVTTPGATASWRLSF